MNDAEILDTIPEAAKLLKVPASWLYDRTRRDAVPLVRVGKYVRIPRQALLAWVKRGCPERWQEEEAEVAGND